MITLEQQKELLFLIAAKDEAKRQADEDPCNEDKVEAYSLAVINLFEFIDRLVV